MNRTARLLLRIAGLARHEPRTRLRRTLRHLERLLMALVLAYAALHAFPQLMFAHSISERGITLYARRELPARAAERLAKARDLVDCCELAVPGRVERIFLCGSPWLFRLFAPLSPHAFAVSVPLTDHVFVAAADLDSDAAYSRATDYGSRSFSGLVAHEVSHGLIRRRLGLWRAWRLPAWITEGYCDDVAGGGSFPEAEGLRLLAAGESHPSPSFRYFMYRRMVTYLVRDRRLPFEELVKRSGDEDAVRAAVRGQGGRSGSNPVGW